MKKLSIILAAALVLTLAMPAFAADVDISGELEVENEDIDGSRGDLSTTLTLFLESQVSNRVSVFSELGITDDTFDVEEAYVDVSYLMGPASLRTGKMDLNSTDDMLYDFDPKDYVSFYYDEGNVAASLAHEVNEDLTVADLSITNLEGINSLDFDYYNENDLDGYTLKAASSFDVVDAALLFGRADNGDSGNLVNLDLSSDQLVPGANFYLNYADVDAEYVADFGESYIVDYYQDNVAEDYDVIRPGVDFDVTDELNIDFSYAMFDGDNDFEEDYLNLLATYKLATDTTLEVEYENWDEEDNEQITTTLTTKF